MAAVKTPEERGPLSAWLYESRVAVDLSPEAVVERLGRYNAGTIRKADSDSANVSRPLWRALTGLYLKVAQEKGKALAPAPLMSGDSSAGTGDTTPVPAAYLARVDDLVKVVNDLVGLVEKLLRDDERSDQVLVGAVAKAVALAVQTTLREAGVVDGPPRS